MPFDLEAEERRKENQDAERMVSVGEPTSEIAAMVAFLARRTSSAGEKDGVILQDDWADK